MSPQIVCIHVFSSTSSGKDEESRISKLLCTSSLPRPSASTSAGPLGTPLAAAAMQAKAKGNDMFRIETGIMVLSVVLVLQIEAMGLI
eukprot:CAMPEP_0115617650 /NCGR_PEP_ID=MMETSP0272-20121206/23752_1 /TAXON_ID=71861 /ORGANISM="Scrippsiella trochoidea, Strain CCMP3099" /LENGTH=87 /DNA_ID=CAMNT_0003053609 /DNA_START=426 /DNA_END=686 /DNA_ORIENTATION=+